MPEPVPAPTAEQLVIVAEITMLPVSTVTLMVSADDDQDVSNAKWARTIEDIEAWPAIRDETGEIKRVGSIEFFEGMGVLTRLDFRNRIRSRYGQVILLSESGRVFSDMTGYAVTVTADW
jgi:hypothetical protein